MYLIQEWIPSDCFASLVQRNDADNFELHWNGRVRPTCLYLRELRRTMLPLYWKSTSEICPSHYSLKSTIKATLQLQVGASSYTLNSFQYFEEWTTKLLILAAFTAKNISSQLKWKSNSDWHEGYSVDDKAGGDKKKDEGDDGKNLHATWAVCRIERWGSYWVHQNAVCFTTSG